MVYPALVFADAINCSRHMATCLPGLAAENASAFVHLDTICGAQQQVNMKFAHLSALF